MCGDADKNPTQVIRIPTFEPTRKTTFRNHTTVSSEESAVDYGYHEDCTVVFTV